ncbi:MAG: acetoacetate--CoA ligase [Bacteroidota bacterium]
MKTDLLWKPTKNFVEESHINQYRNWLFSNRGLKFDDYEALWRWSTTEIADFWESLWQYFNIRDHGAYTDVLIDHGIPRVEWFPGARINYAEHIWRQKNNQRPALIFQNEIGRKEISWTELEQQVTAVQHHLRRQSIQAGDTVAAYLPNIPEAIACFLAVCGLGAVWSCCSPDFGAETVVERFAQIQPKLLIACDGYRYGGKSFSRLAQVDALRQQIDSIEATLFIPYLNPDAELANSTHWDEMIGTHFPLDEGLRDAPTSACLPVPSRQGSPIFTPLPFDHPIWVLYSSGTTGRPKAITHGHGGVLLEHLKYHAFHNDTRAGEHYFWFSTTGWMMWNFLQASMLMGATPVLFDGSPGYPSLDVLWQMAEELPIHHFGTSAPYLTACMKKELQPGLKFNLDALRSIGSTGAPLPPEAFEWMYKDVKQDLWLCSMSGGTDVCTAFVGGIPEKPVHKGRIQGRALGCALYAYDESGHRVQNQLGEMVIEHPMPSMPIYFWGDEGNERYRSSYFSTFPDKWRHGDWIKLFDDGSLIIHGRSDATLNRKGVRIGTAEIYQILDQIPELADALVLNIEQDDGSDIMPLFIKLANGAELNEELENTIKLSLRQRGSPRHVPDYIQHVPDIPYTLSGKKLEVPIKKIFMGMDVSRSLNQDALRNPEALDFFIELASKI